MAGQSIAERLNLTVDDLRKIRDARKRLAELLPVIEAIDKCGTDCAAFLAMANAMDAKLLAYETELFNPLPPTMIEDGSQ